LLFQEDAAAQWAAAVSPLAAALRSSRPLTLNPASLQTALAAAPLAGRPNAAPVLLALPLPDGTNGRFRVVESPLLAPNLVAQYPTIKTYSGVGVDDPTATVQLDVTPRGFHAQILSDRNGTVYIDPVTRTDTQHYLSFARSAMPTAQLNCGVTDHVSAAAHRSLSSGAPRTAQRTSGTVLRTYRLAVAATGEYTAFQGGTAALGYAAIVTTVNRVRGVYEKELAVSFTLVSTSATVYTNAATDPYTNADPDALLTQNQANLDNNSVIGTANYDIGHVFSTAGGGLAGLGVICRAGEKAQGETGTSSPVGDAFDIDYVAHEMGHQSGANHTFNADGASSGSCEGNRNASTAYEPGAGTTIMAYAGICGSANNAQNNSDAYFHVASYEEIQTYLATTSCGTTTANANTVPTVTLPASSKVLPIATPFKLTAVGSDADADALTYCWEEYDLGSAGSPTAAQAANNTVPLFRSFPPSSSATRYFPRLSDIINNTSTLGERLPTVTRGLNFRVTLRDRYTTGNTGTGAVGSVNSSPVVALSSTSAAGPFLVTAPNTAVTWAGNSTQTVTWTVAGTTANGVNCATVNIRLSTDGGLTYPTLLLAGTANDGSAAITVPSTASTQARIMVEAADNYFFDISNANFTITAATACNPPTGLSVGSITATTATLSFTTSGAATSYVVTTSPTTTTQTVTASPVSLTGLLTGTQYTVFVQSGCAAGATSTAASVSFITAAPPVCNAVTSLSVGSITATTASVSFTASAGASNYVVTTSPATSTYTATASPVSLTGLTAGTSYTVNILTNCSNGGTATTGTTFGTPPANDNCAGAINLVSGTSCTTTAGTVARATQSQAASACTGSTSTSALDVWYSFVASGTAHTVTLASAFDGVLGIFNGDCGSLTSRTCADGTGAGGTESISLTGLTVNTRYYIRVYPYTSSGSPAPTVANSGFTICVTGTVAPTCAAPTSLSAGSITNTSASISFTPNAQASSYTVTTSPATTTQSITASPVSLTGLTAGTAYTVSIATSCQNGLTSTAATVSFTTTTPPATTTTSLSSNANPSAFGQTVTLTATVSSGSGTPTGTVTFSDGATSLGTATLSSGTATLTTSALSVSSHSLTATYNGDSSFSGSSSTTLTQVVNLASTATTLTSSPNPSAFGQTVTLTATASSTTGTPTGSVSFYNGNSLLGNATLSGGTGALNVSSLTAGSHSLTAIYSGSSSFATSTSATVTQVVNQASTTTTLTSSLNPSAPGQSVMLTATLSPSAAAGTVTFFAGATSLGTGTLSAGVATLSTSALATGSHSLTATYNGSTNYAGSTSATLTQVVNAAAPAITSLAPNSGVVGSSVTITGTNLTGATAVDFNGTVATAFTVNSATSITTAVPTGASTGSVTVTTPGGTSNGLIFTVTLPDLVVTTATTIPTSSYHNVTITSTGSLTLSGPLNVAGTMVVQDGGVLITSYNLVQGAGSFTLAAGGTLQVFSLAGLSASGATGSIQNSGTRSFSTDASYVYQGTQAQVTGAGLPATVRNLTLNNPGGVALSADVSIREALTPAAGTFTTTGRVLTLLSDATSTAYVAYTRPTAGTISGSLTVQRYVDGSLNAGPGYRHFSAPVTNTTFADLAAGSFAPVVNGAYNTAAQPGLTVPYPTVFGYDQARVGTAANNLTGFDKGWFSSAALSEGMSSGQGYTVHAPAGITVDFVGLPAQTDLPKPGLSRSAQAEAGWHLLGNPYPAAINWDSLRLHGGLTGLDNALYVFKSSGTYAGSYASYVNGIATNSGGPVLPLGQGFFVRTSAAGAAGQLTFHNTDRLNTSTAPAFQRGTADARPLLRLALSSPGAGTDETVVYLENTATATGPDAAHDAAKLRNPGAVLSLASQMAGPGSEPLAINGLPLPTAATTSVPLTLQLPAAGAYIFTLTTLRNFDPTAAVALLDHARNTRTDLRLTPGYAFTAAQPGALNGRFELLLGRPGTVTATTAAAGLQLSVWPNPVSPKALLHVQLEQAAPTATATLRDMLGRVITQRTFNGASVELATARLAAGTYLLTVDVAGQAPATRRVVVE
jgi:hypothetical protein